MPERKPHAKRKSRLPKGTKPVSHSLIRSLRRDRAKVTQKQMADHLGMNRTTYYYIEEGTYTAKMSHMDLFIIVKSAGLEITDILNAEGLPMSEEEYQKFFRMPPNYHIQSQSEQETKS